MCIYRALTSRLMEDSPRAMSLPLGNRFCPRLPSPFGICEARIDGLRGAPASPSDGALRRVNLAPNYIGTGTIQMPRVFMPSNKAKPLRLDCPDVSWIPVDIHKELGIGICTRPCCSANLTIPGCYKVLPCRSRLNLTSQSWATRQIS